MQSPPVLPFLLVFLLLGCGSDDETPKKKPASKPEQSNVAQSKVAQSKRAPATAEAGLSDAMAAEFGAACMVPESSSAFVSSLRLKEQWELVRDSTALRLLLDLPTVQMGLAELQRSRPWMELQQMRKQVPQVQAGIDVLADAFSQEAFLCMDERWPDVVSALSALYLRTTIASMRDDPIQTVNAVVAAIVDDSANLRLPGTLLGFRLADPKRARALLDGLAAQLAGGPVPLQVEEIAGGRYHTLRLNAMAIPPQVRRELDETLSQAAVPPDRVAKLNAWIDQQTLAVAVGLREDYLLLSIGGDTSQLSQLGGEASLAKSARFAPVRGVFKPGVLSLSYLCAGLTNSGKIELDKTLAMIDEGINWLGRLPEGLAPRLRKDAAGLLADINDALPEAHDELAVSFRNRGVETYSFGAVAPGVDASRPLSILTHAGPAPLIAFAGRSLSSKHSYERLVHWCGVAYDYFEDYAVPQMSKRERTEFARFEKTFLPAMRELHATTAGKLIPAVDACQGMFVLEGGGALAAIPGSRTELSAPLRYPRPALVFEINDAALLTEAFADYRKTINGFLSAMAKSEPDLAGVQLPAPNSRAFGGGKLYAHDLPIPPQLKLLPHAVVTKDRAWIAIAEEQSKALLAATPLPANGVVDLSLAAGSAGWIDIAGISNLLFDDAEILLDWMAKEREVDPQTADMIRGHIPVARSVIGVFRSYTSRTWIESDTMVTHSWLHMEDAKR